MTWSVFKAAAAAPAGRMTGIRAFVLSLATLVILLVQSGIDHGFLGLIFLIILVVFLVAFSLLVAAATPGWSIKVAVAVFDGTLAFGWRR
jgi:hypothetical protein